MKESAAPKALFFDAGGNIIYHRTQSISAILPSSCPDGVNGVRVHRPKDLAHLSNRLMLRWRLRSHTSSTLSKNMIRNLIRLRAVSKAPPEKRQRLFGVTGDHFGIERVSC